MERLYILLTVDWEADHGIWHDAPPDEEDYGGILVGTQGLVDLLDEMQIPCTWLVECHMDHRERDMIRLFPDAITSLLRREQDEIGTHIHWARRENGVDHYPLDDKEGIIRQVAHATAGLRALDAQPVSFRGGSFLQVPYLPEILDSHGYGMDSTYTLPNKWRGLTTRPAQPYRCRPENFAEIGDSRIVEFPTHFRVGGKRFSWLIDRVILFHAAYLAGGTQSTYLTLYLHIDELTLPGSGRDADADVDYRAVHRLRKLFAYLMDRFEGTFITMQKAGEHYLNYHFK
ncbi:MAG: hypothetical protein VYA69_11980 [Gemmatimonadota bacterium]|nr:hypothetical protein [Gemmatimonadota bacterium]